MKDFNLIPFDDGSPMPYVLKKSVGGLIGNLNKSTMNNCYVDALVVALYTENITGGIAGTCGLGSVISNSYSVGRVADTEVTGGIAGETTEDSEINNSYFNENTSGKNDSGKGFPEDTEYMLTESSYKPSAQGIDPWGADTMYAVGDRVEYSGLYYHCIGVPGDHQPPYDRDYWRNIIDWNEDIWELGDGAMPYFIGAETGTSKPMPVNVVAQHEGKADAYVWWEAPQGDAATGYEVYTRKPFGEYVLAGTVTGEAPTADDPFVIEDVSWETSTIEVSVLAIYAGDIKSTKSKYAPLRSDVVTVFPPVITGYDVVHDGGFTLHVGPGLGDAGDSYRIDIATDINFVNILPAYNNVAASGTSLEVFGLSAATTYYVRSKKIISGVSSLYSIPYTAVTGNAYPLAYGAYTEAEVDALVADGYVPINSFAEFIFARMNFTTVQKMGLGTKWEADYNCGSGTDSVIGKKFVQVNDIDMALTRDASSLSAYNSGTTYSIGNMVTSGGWVYVSRVNNNTNNALPSSSPFFNNYWAKGWETAKGWNGFGYAYSLTRAYGITYDGAGRTINNMYINNSAGNLGLFTEIRCATVSGVKYKATLKNMGVINAFVNCPANYAGIISGTVVDGSIEDSFVSGILIGTAYRGGVFGLLNPAITDRACYIKNVFSSVINIGTTNMVGGITGYLYTQGYIKTVCETGYVMGSANYRPIKGATTGTTEDAHYDKETAMNVAVQAGETSYTTTQMTNGTLLTGLSALKWRILNNRYPSPRIFGPRGEFVKPPTGVAAVYDGGLLKTHISWIAPSGVTAPDSYELVIFPSTVASINLANTIIISGITGTSHDYALAAGTYIILVRACYVSGGVNQMTTNSQYITYTR